MKRKLIVLFAAFMVLAAFSFAQVRYSGSRHTYSHGGRYAGGHGSSHRGGHYRNRNTGNHYGRHKR